MALTAIAHREMIAKSLQKMALPFAGGFTTEHLSGDGSDRVFYRVRLPEGKKMLFVFPSPTNPKAMLEAAACFSIGRHLQLNRVAVPRIYHFDEISGVIVYEDLGATLLYDLAVSAAEKKVWDNRGHLSLQVLNLYQKALESLVRLQISGAKGFDSAFCWETPTYSKNLMLERESGYFLEAYCRNYRGLSEFPAGLEAEFSLLAERVAEEPAHYLMHRDFQSRNLMVKDGDIRIIDFQGARFGPLAYDLASLLNDPYVQLPLPERNLLFEHYVEAINKYIFLDRDLFRQGYYHVALQRNLQILGAFSFLAKVKGKSFFIPYIQPALAELNHKLQGDPHKEYPVLADFTEALAHT
jgi:hypothetical protein